MVSLHSLPSIVQKSKKRLGRGLGSGAGAKSGRGTTRHQKARRKIPIHFEGGQNRAVKKYPLLRGKGRNKSVQVKPFALSLAKLSHLKENSLVNIELLLNEKIINMSTSRRGVKIVSTGEITVPLKITLPVTKKAKDKIEKAGGEIVIS